MLVIETNISCDIFDDLIDHQSRVINVGSWDEYISQYINKNSNKYSGTMFGKSFYDSWEITDLNYDEQHLMCDFKDNSGLKICKLAYLLQEEFSLQFTPKGE